MSASAGITSVGLPGTSAMLPASGTEDFGNGRLDPVLPRPGVGSLRQRWERPLTWWSVIGLCFGFWYGILHLAGAV